MGAGLAAKNEGELRLTLDVVRGLSAKASHDEDKGLSSTGQVVSTPLHRHHVELDFTRIELSGQYAFAEGWDVWGRVSYDIRERTARVQFVESATSSEQADMQRNLDQHHGSQTLEGFADVNLLIAHRIPDLFQQGDFATIAFGSSVPTGKTEEDPFVAGNAGQPHEHIQFGTGTFDPLLEIFYNYPVTNRVGVAAFGLVRSSFYENSRGYQAPVEVTIGALATYTTTDWLTLRAGLSGFHQGYAHWNGTRDINSGLLTSSIMFGGDVRIAESIYTSINFTLPLSQRTLANDGDTFEQGAVITITTSYSF